MPTRLVSVVVDTPDPRTLADWWSDALDWPVTHETECDGESYVFPPEGTPGLHLVFVPVTDPRSEQNRVHLDLASDSPEVQAAMVGRLTSSGARPVDVGQGDVPWQVLADPEGNEFCVLEPREEYRDSGPLAAVVVQAADPPSLARFWLDASGWKLGAQDDDSVSLRRPDGVGPWLDFVRSDRPRTVKNRVHLDVAPYPDDDQAAEVARLHALGARPADVGQSPLGEGGVTWVVLADPEGNEFCVLSPR